jgi:hypothetical protein
VESADGIDRSPVRDRLVIFDRDGLTARVPPPDPPASCSEAKLASLRGWYASVCAVAETADPLLMREVVHVLRWILYEAYVETNRPLPYTSLKRWSAKLTGTQAATMEALPTSGDPAPIRAALDEVLGRPDIPPEPRLGSTVFPPEGTVRALNLANEPVETRARHIAEEFFAIHLYLTVVLHRQDWLLGLEGGALLRKLCYELCLEENGRHVATSPADWSGRLNAEQRDELLALPTGHPSRDGVVTAALAVREAFCRRGRRVLGARWPTELERTVIRHVDAQMSAKGS